MGEDQAHDTDREQPSGPNLSKQMAAYCVPIHGAGGWTKLRELYSVWSIQTLFHEAEPRTKVVPDVKPGTTVRTPGNVGHSQQERSTKSPGFDDCSATKRLID